MHNNNEITRQASIESGFGLRTTAKVINEGFRILDISDMRNLFSCWRPRISDWLIPVVKASKNPICKSSPSASFRNQTVVSLYIGMLIDYCMICLISRQIVPGKRLSFHRN